MLLKNGQIDISPDPRHNILEYEGQYFDVSYLKAGDKYPQRGGNGVVFKLTDADDNEYAIKICRISYEEAEANRNMQKRLDRFAREIEALYLANENRIENIIELVFTGDIEISGKTYNYYAMEKCDSHLGDYLSKSGRINPSQKLFLFSQIVQGIKALHDLDIYHRDIKFSNILFNGSQPKIADLGLVAYRDSEYLIYEKGEAIGPTGWYSPEATNKFLVEKTSNPHKFICEIGSKSDVFQLGKLFWYIFQGNLPLGQITLDDFVSKDARIYEIIFLALQHSTDRRITVDELEKKVFSLFPDFNL